MQVISLDVRIYIDAWKIAVDPLHSFYSAFRGAADAARAAYANAEDLKDLAVSQQDNR